MNRQATDGSRRRRRARRAAFLTTGLLALAAPALSYAAGGALSTADLTPTFVAGTSGGSAVRLAFKATYAPAELTSELGPPPWHAVVHLPEGTALNFSRLPRSGKRQLVGSAQLEQVSGGKPQFVTTSVYRLGGAPAMTLVMSPPLPFVQDDVVVETSHDGGRFAAQEIILTPLSQAEAGPSAFQAITSLSVTLGGTVPGGAPLVVPPKTCPRGGYSWRVDFSTSIAPERSVPATSSCSGKGSAARPARARAAGKPRTAFQCQKAFHTARGRTRCFARLPGADCAHPLEAQKTDPEYRGDTFAFKTTLRVEPYADAADFTLTVNTAPNVELCPYPNGAVFHTADDYVKLPDGREIPQEHNVQNIPLHFSRHGGSYTRTITAAPVTSWYFILRGRYVHSPWASRR